MGLIYHSRFLQMVREEGFSSLGRGVGPNVFRAILMNASQLASYVYIIPCLNSSLLFAVDRYDFFKAELLKTPYFGDNIMCHFTASFAAVRFVFSESSHSRTRRSAQSIYHKGNGSDHRLLSCRCAQEQNHECFWPRFIREFDSFSLTYQVLHAFLFC